MASNSLRIFCTSCQKSCKQNVDRCNLGALKPMAELTVSALPPAHQRALFFLQHQWSG